MTSDPFHQSTDVSATPEHQPSVPNPGASADLVRDRGFSPDAVRAMRRALARSGGRMAQFDHPEFGGLGQWMQGGLVMTSTGRDPVLEARIDRLCEALDREVGSRVPGTGADAVSNRARPSAASAPTVPRPHATSASTVVDPFAALEQLAGLHARGIVSDGEFLAKKTELLARI